MRLISQAAKETIVKKALNRGTVKLRDIAIQNNVSYPSITKWIRQYKNNELKLLLLFFQVHPAQNQLNCSILLQQHH